MNQESPVEKKRSGISLLGCAVASLVVVGGWVGLSSPGPQAVLGEFFDRVGHGVGELASVLMGAAQWAGEALQVYGRWVFPVLAFFCLFFCLAHWRLPPEDTRKEKFFGWFGVALCLTTFLSILRELSRSAG